MVFSQLIYFGVMFLFGMIMGLCLYGYNLYLGKFKLSSAIIAIMDVLWGLFFGCLGFYILLLLNKGQLRLYILLAVFLGWLCCYSFLSKFQK